MWTAAKNGERRPVLVWLHGGALTRGSSTSDVRDGGPLAQKGIVLVSINYRLGPLGYLAHSASTPESPHRSSDYFTYVPPSPRAAEMGAFHAGELPYVFNVIPSDDPREAGFTYTDADRALADTMSSYWVNFITTGDPNGKSLPQWPQYAFATEPYLEFGRTIKLGNYLLKAQLDFLEKALARFQ